MPVMINNNWQEQIPDKLMALLSSGQGIFETILFEDDILWFWELHWQRMQRSLRFFNISKPKINMKDYLLERIMELNSDQPLRIKLVCLFPFDSPPISISQDNIVLQIDVAEKTASNARPLTLKTIPLPIAPHNPLIGHKTLAYTHLIYSRKLALESGYDDVLFYNQNNMVLETSYSNIFAVKNGKIVTPRLSAGLLAGTVRSVLIEVLQVNEIDISVDDLSQYDYCFLTSSVRELRCIGQIDDHLYRINKPTFTEIQAKWMEIKRRYKKGKIS